MFNLTISNAVAYFICSIKYDWRIINVVKFFKSKNAPKFATVQYNYYTPEMRTRTFFWTLFNFNLICLKPVNKS